MRGPDRPAHAVSEPHALSALSALTATDIRKSFPIGGHPAEILRGLSLDLPEGAFHAVMGPSGSGKTTLLNILAGLLRPDAGTVTVGGTDLTALGDRERTLLRRRTVGIVFQDYNLIPTLTVAENIALPALLDGKTLHRLSGGEAQRTAIARAFAPDPKVILADEPTGNLDSPAAHRFCDVLRTMNRELKTAILLISHDPQTACAAERVHFLRDGVFVGTHEGPHDPARLAADYLRRMA